MSRKRGNQYGEQLRRRQEKPVGAPLEEAPLVTVVKPGGEKDITLLTEAGPIRFLEGRAHGVPLPVALKLVSPGWAIEP